jgi:hypothetical protein
MYLLYTTIASPTSPAIESRWIIVVQYFAALVYQVYHTIACRFFFHLALQTKPPTTVSRTRCAQAHNLRSWLKS